MTPALRNKWITRLRSGKEKQGTWYLHKVDESKCCLGVLLTVAKEPHDDSVLTRGSYAYFYNGNAGDLSSKLCCKFGITYLEMRTLANFNDNDGWTFEKIADWIEANIIPVEATPPEEKP